MALTLKQLRYFLEIARGGSFTAAAHSLSIAQPALSYQIGQLERHLGAPLFARTAKGVTLADAGRTLLAHAPPILRALADAEAAVRDRGAVIAGAVCVGLLSSLAPFVTPLLIGECRRRFPQVTVSVEEGDYRMLLDHLRDGRLDLALTLPRSTAGAELPLATEELFLYSRRGGPAAGRRTIGFAEALRHRLVLPPPAQMMRDQIEAVATERGLSVKVEVEAGYAAGKSLVLAGIGCGIANFAALKPEFEAGTLDAALLVDPPIGRTLVLAMPRDERTDRAVVEVRRLLQQAVHQLSTSLRWRPLAPPD